MLFRTLHLDVGILLAITGALSAAVLAAQQPPSPRGGPAVVLGQVTESETGAPAPEALVLLGNGRRATTDSAGRFRIPDVLPGRYRIAAVSWGCQVAVGFLHMKGDSPVEVHLLVSPADDEAASVAVGREAAPGLGGSPVRIIGAAELRRTGQRTLLDVLRSEIPHMVGFTAAGAGRAPPISGRGATSLTQSQAPVVIVDGTRIEHEPEHLLGSLDPMSLARVEIYRGAAGAWEHGAGAASGVIRVYTRTMGGRLDPDTPPEDCGFRFPPEGGT